MANCKSCKAEILWVTMEKSERKNPLDIVPSPNGNIVVMQGAGANNATALAVKGEKRDQIIAQGQKLYTSHFVTCPDRAKFRRTDRKAETPAR